jgi:hypothetical protein
MSSAEFEELYGNKSKYGLVMVFGPLIIDVACRQIGINEIRRCCHLKAQPINFFDKIDEISSVKQSLSDGILDNFKEKVHYASMDYFSSLKFWPEDVKNAEVFLDKKFPEVRLLFQHKYKELKICKNVFNNQSVDEAFSVLWKIRRRVMDSFQYSNGESLGAFNGNILSNCYEDDLYHFPV